MLWRHIIQRYEQGSGSESGWTRGIWSDPDPYFDRCRIRNRSDLFIPLKLIFPCNLIDYTYDTGHLYWLFYWDFFLLRSYVGSKYGVVSRGAYPDRGFFFLKNNILCFRICWRSDPDSGQLRPDPQPWLWECKANLETRDAKIKQICRKLKLIYSLQENLSKLYCTLQWKRSLNFVEWCWYYPTHEKKFKVEKIVIIVLYRK